MKPAANISKTYKRVIDEIHFFRNNDGFITKQEMLNATKKLTEKQVKLQTFVSK